MPSLLPNELILLMRLFDLVSAVAGADCEAPGGGGPGGRLCGCGGCGGGCPSGGGGPGGGGGRVPGSTTLTEPAFMIISCRLIHHHYYLVVAKKMVVSPGVFGDDGRRPPSHELAITVIRARNVSERELVACCPPPGQRCNA